MENQLLAQAINHIQTTAAQPVQSYCSTRLSNSLTPEEKKVLKHHFPNAESLTDITKTDFTKYNGTIDIISGGFPCQPYSLAGKRKGKEDERHLWPEMFRAIREVQPRWVVGENVFGLLNWNRGMVFHEVQTDLEAAGYFTFPYVLPACSVNAPHRRDRVWIVAYSETKNTNGLRIRANEAHPKHGNYGDIRITTNTNSYGCDRSDALNDVEQVITADTNNIRLQGGMHQNRTGEAERHTSPFDTWINQWNSWKDFPTQPPLCSRNDGLSGELVGITVSKHRIESIKGYGNAIVPQVALQIFKAIEQTELNFIV